MGVLRRPSRVEAQTPTEEDPMDKLIKLSLPLAAVALLAATGFVSWHFLGASTSSAAPSAPCGSGHPLTLFGHVKSLTPSGESYELRFDPAWFLSGVTANVAAAEDGAVEPGQPVPNDNYVLEEGHRLLTYVVPDDARITVLTRTGTLDTAGFPSAEITVADLARLVDGKQPVKLAEPLDSGFWMRANVDKVCSLEQQYRP
jgi:hypothetical protein